MVRRLWIVASVVFWICATGVGCASAPAKTDQSLTRAQVGPPAFFDEIPASTPYVMTSLKPFPRKVLQPLVERSFELLDTMEAQARHIWAARSANGPAAKETSEASVKFALALYEQLSKARTLEGLKKLGFSARPQAAVYGLGWFPVARVTLANPEALEGAISRAEIKSGMEANMRTVNGQTYRDYKLFDDLEMAVAITDDELIIGAAPSDVFDLFLAYMLGQKRPKKSLADTGDIQAIQREYGYEPYTLGFIDIAGLAGGITGATPADPITASMMEAVGAAPMNLSSVCRQEYMSIFEKMPRAVFGYTEFSARRLAMETVLETTGDLSEKLAQTRAHIPAYGTDPFNGALMSIGLGVNVEKFAQFARRQASRIVDEPFQCSDFRGWNHAAKQVQTATRMVPSFVADIRGLTAVVSNIQWDAQMFDATGYDALAFVETSDPGGLLAQLQMYVPKLKGVGVKSDGVPVAVDLPGVQKRIEQLHLAMTDSTLAASAGVGEQDEMAVVLEENPADTVEAPLAVVVMDYGKFMSRVAKFMKYMLGGMTPRGRPSPQFFTKMGQIVDQVVGEVDANEHGIVWRWRMTIPPDQAATSNR